VAEQERRAAGKFNGDAERGPGEIHARG
jgi:hypothetical protein